MEIKANFLLIGLFTLLGLGAVLAAFVWLGSFRLDRDEAVYGVLFNDVSGLTVNGEVVFNGLPVGRVTELRLHAPDPSLIYARIEIDAATPVRGDTIAQLSSQGVTGIAYVALSGGSPSAPLLNSVPDDPALIPSRRTGLQTLLNDAPVLFDDVAALVADVRVLVGPDTQTKVARILTNLDSASAKLDTTLDGMAELTEGLSAAATQIGGLGDTIAALEGQVGTTLANADSALIAATGTFDAATPAIADLRTALDLTRDLLAQEGPDTLAALRSGVAGLDTTLESAETAFDALARAADRIDELASGDGAALLASARGTLSAVEPALRDDLPATLSDLRAASAETRAALTRITDGIAGTTDQLDPLATDARAALAEVTALLERGGTTLDTLDGALASADGAFATAGTIMEADIGPAMADIRAAADAIARDLPTLTARADTVLRDIANAVAVVTPGLRDFGATTLPEFGRLATETRTLVRGLSDLVRQIRNNPVGLIQGGQVPEYRR
ncbi:MlaD family protein [Jannaschia pohangensis]|uniref:Phospholipid/cholesterol/gamma-HCH transport system substrate-binding protein n=1 Tax=Jannaschia pohangensis TaxID=390807 RepID=A0A1I3H1B7_9RHOB|nr:MlaD family protein [Jannaschia pohangensis]SFI29340.1 phospholipid/cholesterol/gamma-HCH transport system substrate-binding protein [Jannaschia pohangensis]